MVKIFQHSYKFEYSWDAVSVAFWLRYPNPFSAHVLGSDVIERYVDDNGILHTKRVILKKGKLPRWGATFINAAEAYIIEETTVDPKKQTLISKTKNLSHVRVMQVEETQTFTTHKSRSEWTAVKSEARIISRFGWGVTSAIEKFGMSTFEKNSLRSHLGMSYILERLRGNNWNQYVHQ